MKPIFYLLFACTLSQLVGCGQQATSTTNESEDRAPVVLAGVQSVTVELQGDNGNDITVEKGVKVELTVIQRKKIGPRSCGSVLSIPAHDILQPLTQNEEVKVSFIPLQSGTMKWACGGGGGRVALVY